MGGGGAAIQRRVCPIIDSAPDIKMIDLEMDHIGEYSKRLAEVLGYVRDTPVNPWT